MSILTTTTKFFVAHQQCWTTVDPHVFYAEASDLRLPIGKFPRFIGTDMGNKEDFFRVRCEEDGTVIYRQQFGCLTLRVFND